MQEETSFFVAFVFILMFLIYFLVSFRNSSRYRKRIKEKANREFNADIEPSIEELKDRLGVLELEYENLEQEHWLAGGVASGLISYVLWHIWYVSLFVGLAVFFLGWKYIAIRPFTNGMADYD